MSLDDKLQVLMDNRKAVCAPSKARERMEKLFDEGTFTELGAFAKAGENGSGVITGCGYVAGCPVYAFSQDESVNSGAVGRVHGAKVAKLYDLAAKNGVPVVGIYDSNGANLNEGADALAAYGDMLSAASALSGVVPQISAVLGTCAGSAAMQACLADFVIMSKKAELFLTAPFVAKARGEGAEGAGTAANAVKSGAVQVVAKDDDEALEKVKTLVSLLPQNNLAAAPFVEYGEDAAAAAGSAADLDAVVQAVADTGSVFELSGDFGKNALTAFATVAGSSCGVVATRSAPLGVDECAKIARFVSICDSFALSVITFVDTEGFAPSSKAELAGAIRESAKLAHVYAEATCPKIAVVTGSAIGSAYIALAGKNAGSDMTFAWPTAVISALNPEAAATVLWSDRGVNPSELAEEYKATLGSPYEAAKGGYVDDIIDPADTRKALVDALEMFAGKRVSRLPKKHGNIPM